MLLKTWGRASMARTGIKRSEMSAEERALRSQLNQLGHAAGLMRGTLSVREVTCGKSNCRCARGEKHVCLVLVAREKGKINQLYIPKDWEIDVRRWVDAYRRAQDHLEGISRIYWEKVQKRER
jgi:hypothetical protein